MDIVKAMTNRKTKASKGQLVSKREKGYLESEYARPGSSVCSKGVHKEKVHISNDDEFEGHRENSTAILKFDIPKRDPDDRPVTKVTVMSEDKIDEDVDFNEIKQIIKENKKIKKVVIEHVKVNEVGKLQLLFSKKGDEDGPLLDDINKRHFAAILNIEKVINQKIFDKMPIKSEVKVELIEDAIDETYIEKETKIQHANMHNGKDENIENKKDISPNLSLNESNNDFKNIELQRDTLIRKNSKTQIAKFYYKAKNHAELFELGMSYLKDFENGVNHFSFYGNQLSHPKQNTIFGVAAFLNYQSNVNITIITQSLKDSIYSKLLPSLQLEKKVIQKENISYNLYISDGLEILEYEELFEIYSSLNIMHFDEFLEEMHLYSDVTLWDLPDMDHLIDYNELFLPIIDAIENVTLIVKSGLTRINDIKDQQEFFKTYHIKVKGIIFDKNKISEKKKKKYLLEKKDE